MSTDAATLPLIEDELSLLADRHVDDVTLAVVRAAFERHCGAGGAHFQRPMHVRLLRRLG